LDKSKAKELANGILKLDNIILGVSIASNTGSPLARARKAGHEGGSPTPEQWGTKSFRIATIFAAARAEDNRLSKTLSIEIVREKAKEVLIYVHSLAIIVDILVDKREGTIDLIDMIRKRMQFDLEEPISVKR
jgi:hypothetical protein